MKILLDHCMDWRLKRFLPAHEVKSAQEMGWDSLKNGKLLAAAAAQSFHALLTVDQHMKDQQNLDQLPIATVVLVAKSNRTADLQVFMPYVDQALTSLKPCQFIEIDPAGNIREITAGR